MIRNDLSDCKTIGAHTNGLLHPYASRRPGEMGGGSSWGREGSKRAQYSTKAASLASRMLRQPDFHLTWTRPYRNHVDFTRGPGENQPSSAFSQKSIQPLITLEGSPWLTRGPSHSGLTVDTTCYDIGFRHNNRENRVKLSALFLGDGVASENRVPWYRVNRITGTR